MIASVWKAIIDKGRDIKQLKVKLLFNFSNVNHEPASEVLWEIWREIILIKFPAM